MEVKVTQFKAKKIAAGLFELAAVYCGKLNNGSKFSFLIRATADAESEMIFAERFDLIEADNLNDNRAELFGIGLSLARQFKREYFA